MRHRTASAFASALCLALTACAPPVGASPAAQAPPTSPTSGPWRQYADPAEAGFDPDRLDRACAYADSVGSAAVMAVHRGRVVTACGAVDRELELHSVRKSLVSGLFGTAVARGEVDLDATLEELAIDDDAGLTAAERRATVADLLAARSGVYHPAAYAPEGQDQERPERGSHAPGTHWFYSNWDFNVAGVVYERATGEDLYASFQRRIAEPIGMEDFTPADGFRAYEPSESRHPAHTFRMSARDLARFGQLYLQEGRWDGRVVIPGDWVRRSTAPVSDLGDGAGYAWMWWTYAPDALPPERYPTLSGHPIFMGRGSGSQALWVVPSLELVIVHRGDTDHNRGIDGRDAWTIAELIAGAREGDSVSEPRLTALAPTPFQSQLPPYPWPEPEPLDPHEVAPLLGDYTAGPATIRVFRFRGDPYIHVPGEGDARLFRDGGDRYTIRVVPGVRVEFLRDEAGSVTALEMTLGPRTIRAERS